jgi:transmembrane sensor
LTDSETRDRIDAEAAGWAARNALADTTDTADEAFEAWMTADRRRAGAYLRAQASYYALEDAALASPIPTASNDDEPAVQSPSRALPRRALGIGLALTASVAALVFALPVLRGPAAQDAHTLSLADGSHVALGKDGAISAAMDGPTRNILLQRGEATFHVAKDRAHPFIVRSGRVFAEATGTIYSVRRVGESGGAVRVSEGSVLVWAEGGRDAAVMLRAGDALTLDPAESRKVPAAQSFWFEETSIGEAARRFNRVNATRILVADPAIGKVAIVGRFSSDRPDQFAKAAAALTGARVTRREGTLVIEKK